jgi:hypothetical protein
MKCVERKNKREDASKQQKLKKIVREKLKQENFNNSALN